MSNNTSARIAMLIDGDNAQPSNIRGLLQILSRYGDVSVRRLYGDFSQGNMPRWSDAIIQNNLQPITSSTIRAAKMPPILI